MNWLINFGGAYLLTVFCDTEEEALAMAHRVSNYVREVGYHEIEVFCLNETN